MLRWMTALIMLGLSASPALAQRTPADIAAYCNRVQNSEARGESQLYPAQRPTTWRCVNGAAYVCELGASGRACEKMDSRGVPTRSVLDYCRQSPNTNVPNAANDTSFDWTCRGASPVITGRNPVDERGYFKGAWRKVASTNAQQTPLPSSLSLPDDPPEIRAILQVVERSYPPSNFCRKAKDALPVFLIGDDGWAKVPIWDLHACPNPTVPDDQRLIILKKSRGTWSIVCNFRGSGLVDFGYYRDRCAGIPCEAFQRMYPKEGCIERRY